MQNSMDSPILKYFALAYLTIGLLYSLYVVLNKGGGVFSIPINAILGPVFVPIEALSTYLRLTSKSKKLPIKLPPLRSELSGEEEEEEES